MYILGRSSMGKPVKNASQAGGLFPLRVASRGQFHMRQNRLSVTMKMRSSLPGMKLIIHPLL